jgi:hypothetical protein
MYEQDHPYYEQSRASKLASEIGEMAGTSVVVISVFELGSTVVVGNEFVEFQPHMAIGVAIGIIGSRLWRDFRDNRPEQPRDS